MSLFKRRMTPQEQHLYNLQLRQEQNRISKIQAETRKNAIIARAKRDAQVNAQSKGSRLVGGMIRAGKAFGDFAEKMPDIDKVESAWGIGNTKRKGRK